MLYKIEQHEKGGTWATETVILCICLLWAFCYALCWLAVQSCSLVVCVAPGAFLKAVYTGYHGYACS